MFQVSCPGCSKTDDVSDSFFGRRIKCPTCKTRFTAQIQLDDTPMASVALELPTMSSVALDLPAHGQQVVVTVNNVVAPKIVATTVASVEVSKKKEDGASDFLAFLFVVVLIVCPPLGIGLLVMVPMAMLTIAVAGVGIMLAGVALVFALKVVLLLLLLILKAPVLLVRWIKA